MARSASTVPATTGDAVYDALTSARGHTEVAQWYLVHPTYQDQAKAEESIDTAIDTLKQARATLRHQPVRPLRRRVDATSIIEAVDL